MRLTQSLAASALFITAFAPGSIANPIDSPNGLAHRAGTLSQGTCVKPSQIDLSQSRTLDLGSCNWREWALCTAIAAGACFGPCEMGGFVDPLCDACVAAMGTAGCLECVHGSPSEEQLFTETMKFIHNKRRVVVNLLRTQFYKTGQNSTLKIDLESD